MILFFSNTENKQSTIIRVKSPPGLKMGDNNITTLRVAEDAVLLTENEKFLQEIWDVVNIDSENFGLVMNVRKTKTNGLLQKQ